MRRRPELAGLSRDHHHALVIAQTLRRATAESAEETRSALLAYWGDHGSVHFELEERILLPAFAAYGSSHHPLVARTLCDHVEIRQRVNAFASDKAPLVAELRELGVRIAEHVRLEERELFTLIEATMPRDALAGVALALDRAERATGRA